MSWPVSYDFVAGRPSTSAIQRSGQQFAAVIRTIIDSSLAQTPATSQKQIDGWLKGALDGAIRKAQDALVAVTRNFRGKLLGARSYLLWSVFAVGLFLVRKRFHLWLRIAAIHLVVMWIYRPSEKLLVIGRKKWT